MGGVGLRPSGRNVLCRLVQDGRHPTSVTLNNEHDAVLARANYRDDFDNNRINIGFMNRGTGVLIMYFYIFFSFLLVVCFVFVLFLFLFSFALLLFGSE